MTERKFIVSKACVAESTVQELLNKGFRIEQIKMCGKTTGDTTIAVYLVKDDEDDEPKTKIGRFFYNHPFIKFLFIFI